MKVCFAGSGSIGKRHIKNLSDIMERMGENLIIHLFRRQIGQLDDSIAGLIERQIDKMEELDEKYDAVFICNPTSLHYETLSQFLNRTDNFFIEKPVFDVMHIKADLSIFPLNKVYYTACPLRYTSVLLEAKKIVQKEQVISARAISSSYLPGWRPGVDYRNIYSAHKDQGGGVRIDLIHEWDYLVDLFGFPAEVFSLSGKKSDLQIDSEDIAVYIAQYPQMMLEIHLDYFGMVTRRALELRTNEHEYVFDLVRKCVFCDDVLQKEYCDSPNDMYLREMENFMDIVMGRKKNGNDLQHAIQILELSQK